MGGQRLDMYIILTDKTDWEESSEYLNLIHAIFDRLLKMLVSLHTKIQP